MTAHCRSAGMVGFNTSIRPEFSGEHQHNEEPRQNICSETTLESRVEVESKLKEPWNAPYGNLRIIATAEPRMIRPAAKMAVPPRFATLGRIDLERGEVHILTTTMRIPSGRTKQ